MKHGSCQLTGIACRSASLLRPMATQGPRTPPSSALPLPSRGPTRLLDLCEPVSSRTPTVLCVGFGRVLQQRERDRYSCECWSGLAGVRGIASRKGNTCSLLTSFRPSWAGLVGAARLTQRNHNQLKGLQKIVKIRETVRCHHSKWTPGVSDIPTVLLTGQGPQPTCVRCP